MVTNAEFANDISNPEVKQQIAQDKATISMRPGGRGARDRPATAPPAAVDVGEVSVRPAAQACTARRVRRYEGDGPLAPEVVDNDDPSPGVP